MELTSSDVKNICDAVSMSVFFLSAAWILRPPGKKK